LAGSKEILSSIGVKQKLITKVLEIVMEMDMLWEARVKFESGHVGWSGEGAKTSELGDGLRDWET